MAKARPDGRTLLLSNIGQATSGVLYPKLRYDPVKSFEPIGLVAELPMTLVGSPRMAATDFKELRGAMAAAKPRLTYAHAGAGSASHLCGLMLVDALKADLAAVSYPGTAEAMADLTAGRVDLLCDQTSNTLAPILAGRVRVFGVTYKGARRGAAERADPGGGRPAELPARGVARAVRAQGHARRRYCALVHRAAGRAAITGHEAEAGRTRRAALGARCRHAGGVAQASGGRHRPVGTLVEAGGRANEVSLRASPVRAEGGLKRKKQEKTMFDWIADPNAWIALATLTVLEIVLGIDNIIFISILAGRLPPTRAATRAPAGPGRSRWARASRCCFRSPGSCG